MTGGWCKWNEKEERVDGLDLGFTQRLMWDSPNDTIHYYILCKVCDSMEKNWNLMKMMGCDDLNPSLRFMKLGVYSPMTEMMFMMIPNHGW